jgi:hypothetical protein
MQQIGRQAGHSPQEVALYMVAQLPAAHQVDLNVGPIRKWIRQRKINPDASECFLRVPRTRQHDGVSWNKVVLAASCKL